MSWIKTAGYALNGCYILLSLQTRPSHSGLDSRRMGGRRLPQNRNGNEASPATVECSIHFTHTQFYPRQNSLWLLLRSDFHGIILQSLKKSTRLVAKLLPCIPSDIKLHTYKTTLKLSFARNLFSPRHWGKCGAPLQKIVFALSIELTREQKKRYCKNALGSYTNNANKILDIMNH